MRDSDWSRENLLRSDWSGLQGASITTLDYSEFTYVGNKQTKINYKKYITTLLHKKFLQFGLLRAVAFQLNLRYLHVKITYLLWVVV